MLGPSRITAILRVGIAQPAKFFHASQPKCIETKELKILLSILLYALWKKPNGLAMRKLILATHRTRVCWALMSSYVTPRQRIFRVTKEFAKLATYRNGTTNVSKR